MPKIVDKAQRRQEIAQIALNLFAEEGFTIPVQRIAQKVGLSKGSLYVYFRSREELILTALKSWTLGMLQTPLAEMKGARNAAERFRGYCHLGIKNFIDDPRSAKIFVAMLHLVLTGDKQLQELDLFRQYIEFSRDTVTEIIEDGIREGYFRALPPGMVRRTAVNLLAFLDGLVVHSWMSPTIDIMEQVNLYVDQVLKELLPENDEAS